MTGELVVTGHPAPDELAAVVAALAIAAATPTTAPEPAPLWGRSPRGWAEAGRALPRDAARFPFGS